VQLLTGFNSKYLIMEEKILKKFVAFCLTLIMVLSLAVPVMASYHDPLPPSAQQTDSGWSTIGGDGHIFDRPLNVLIPTSLDFNLDPFMISGGADQLSQVGT